jgi:Ni/Co efflux regulator RcnB
MTTLLKGALIAGLLGTVATPALAQRHDMRGQDNHQQRDQQWRNVSASHGHHWRKGQRLAANQRRYVVSDWNRRGLRTPPRGYQWVREDNNSGDFLLVAVATGLIASILSQ